MGKTPLVSILLQSYNHAKYITECINSIYKQTFTDYELIVFDDGSTDGSNEIILHLQTKYSFIYHQHENMGLVNTIIKMLPLIRGKYFILLASDDVLPPKKLELQAIYMENNPECRISGGQALIINESSRKLNDNRFYSTGTDYIDFVDLFIGRKKICSPTLIIKSDLIEELKLFDEHYNLEDLYMLLKITNAGYSIHILNDILCYYRIHGENLHLNCSYIYKETMKIINIYKQNENYSNARRHWGEGIFSTMAIYQKMEAIKIIPQVFNFKFRFFIRLFKLFIPPIVWQLIKGNDRD